MCNQFGSCGKSHVLTAAQKKGLTKRWGNKTLEQRFFEKVVKTDTCWNWIGAVYGARPNRPHYGTMLINKKAVGATRVSLMLHGRKLPVVKNQEIDHLCKNTLCVNPHHLEVVSQYENNRRSNSPTAINLRKSVCIKGHPFYVLKNGERRCATCQWNRYLRYKDRSIPTSREAEKSS